MKPVLRLKTISSDESISTKADELLECIRDQDIVLTNPVTTHGIWYETIWQIKNNDKPLYSKIQQSPHKYWDAVRELLSCSYLCVEAECEPRGVKDADRTGLE